MFMTVSCQSYAQTFK